jgi:protein SCO1/2
MTKKQQKQKNKFSLGLLGFASLVLFSCAENVVEENSLPIHGNRDVEYRMVNGKEIADTIYHVVPAFNYLNQDSIWVSSNSIKEKVWVVDFFFTHCPSICPPMTTNMKRLNTMTSDLKKNIRFLSFSIDPKKDTPNRLQEYIKLNGIKAKNWSFLTGVPAEQTHEMAGEFFSYAKQDESVPGGFGHTSYFVIVDHNGYVRGIYDGLKTEAIDSMANDLRKLLKYEYNITGSKKN